MEHGQQETGQFGVEEVEAAKRRRQERPCLGGVREAWASEQSKGQWCRLGRGQAVEAERLVLVGLAAGRTAVAAPYPWAAGHPAHVWPLCLPECSSS